MDTKTDPAGPIILFDAECILCLANAQFVLSNDRKKRFRLASMQGEVGSALYRRFGFDVDHKLSADTLLNISAHASTVGEAHDVSAAISIRRAF